MIRECTLLHIIRYFHDPSWFSCMHPSTLLSPKCRSCFPVHYNDPSALPWSASALSCSVCTPMIQVDFPACILVHSYHPSVVKTLLPRACGKISRPPPFVFAYFKWLMTGCKTRSCILIVLCSHPSLVSFAFFHSAIDIPDSDYIFECFYCLVVFPSHTSIIVPIFKT